MAWYFLPFFPIQKVFQDWICFSQFPGAVPSHTAFTLALLTLKGVFSVFLGVYPFFFFVTTTKDFR